MFNADLSDFISSTVEEILKGIYDAKQKSTKKYSNTIVAPTHIDGQVQISESFIEFEVFTETQIGRKTQNICY